MIDLRNLWASVPMSRVFLLCVLAAAAFGQEVYVPAHDLRVAVHLPFLQGVLTRFDGLTFGTTFANHGSVCSSPKVFLTMDTVNLADTPWRNWLSGDRGVKLTLSNKMRFYTEDPNPNCRASLDAACQLAADLESLRTDIPFAASCRLSLSFITIARWDTRLTVPMPFRIAEKLPIRLQDVKNDGADLHPEFGEYRNGVFVGAGQEKIVPFRTQISTVRPAVNPPTGSRGAGTLAFDLGIGRHNAASLPSTEAGEAFLGAGKPTNEQEPLGLSIDSAFFGAATSAPNKNWGLFGSVLPIRISGNLQQGGRRFGIELVLSEARAMFLKEGGEDLLAVEFGVREKRVWRIDIGNENILKELGVRLVATVPRVASDGTVTLKVRDFRIVMELGFGSTKVCLDPKGIEQMINAEIQPFLEVLREVAIEPPDCIQMDDDRFEALRPCRNYPGYKKLISNQTPDKKARLLVDISTIRTEVTAGTVRYSLPVTVK